MGTVYQARHLPTGRQVALKLIATYLSRSTQAVRRFETEASALSRIDHPNVVRLVDFGRLPDGSLYLATELLQGQDLGQMLARRRMFSAEELVPYVGQICAGLQAAHDRGVVHRDLKPENIFVMREPPQLQLKLFDFGVAKLLDEDSGPRLTAVGVLVGTPRFVAPEQAVGQPELIGPASDLYTVGVLLYTLLSGAPPFDSEDFGALLFQHVEAPPPPLRERAPHVSPAVCRVVHWCLEKDPARRSPSARVLASAFAAAVRAGHAATAPLPAVSSDAALYEGEDTVPDDHEETLESRELPGADEAGVSETDEGQATSIYEPFRPPSLDDPFAVDPAPDFTVEDASPPPPLIRPQRSRRRVPLWLIYGCASLGLLCVATLSALLVWVIFR